MATYALLFFSPLTAAVQIGVAAGAYAGVWTMLERSGEAALTALEPIILTAVIATTCGIVMWLSKAREHSEIDPLTLTVNRRGLDRMLDSALCEASGAGRIVALAMIDVDHFKSINDREGHAAGDQLLENLARTWKTALRTEDVLAGSAGMSL